MENEIKERNIKFKKNYKIILFIGVVLVLLGVIYLLNNNFEDNSSLESETNTIRLEDDFYSNVNYKIIKDKKIPSGYPVWSLAMDAQRIVDRRKETLKLKILNNKDFSGVEMEKKIELYEDYEERNKRGLSEFQPYFNKIDNAKNINEFNKVLIEIDYDLGVNIFDNSEVTEDLKDTSKNVVYFYPIQIEDYFDIYTFDKYSRYKEEYEKYRNKILKLAGYSENEIASFNEKLYNFINSVQSKSIAYSDVTNPLEIYKQYTVDDIKKNFNNLPILQYLERFNLNNQEFYVFYDMNHYKALEEYYTFENLEFLKMLEKLLILEKIATVNTTENMLQIELELQNKLSDTDFDITDYKDSIISTIQNDAVQEELAILYEEKYFNDKDKEYVRNIIEEVRKYYVEIIKDCEWLDESTKEEALKKLSSMKINIGYQGSDDSDNTLKFVSKEDGGTIISNYILENRSYYDNLDDKLNSKGNGSYSLDTFEINAFYNPLDNSINFTAAFKELYGDEDNYYKLLGYVGSVAGHEISHAFDLSGSKFDENGKVNDWWTEEDKENYEKLTKKIISYYDKYKISKYNVNGERTLSENIADLASIKCMMKIMKEKGAKEEDYKAFFEAYANLYASKATENYYENQILKDDHSPNKVRVNAVLSSTPEFYEVYNIKETDKMYVKEEDRVGIW